MIQANQNSPTEPCQEALDVLKHQTQTLHQMEGRLELLVAQTNPSIQQTEDLLAEFGIQANLPEQKSQSIFRSSRELRSWAEIVADADANINCPGLITDILTADEIRQVEHKIAQVRGDFDSIHRLDKLDSDNLWRRRHAGSVGSRFFGADAQASWLLGKHGV